MTRNGARWKAGRKRTVPIKVLESVSIPPRRSVGVAVNRYFSVWRSETGWELVHRATGLRTHHRHSYSQADMVALGRAATAKFRDLLTMTDYQLLIDALKKAGSEQWADSWWISRSEAIVSKRLTANRPPKETERTR